ncbi:MAG: hypothetical protein L0H55_04930 [Candidatus Nitrosocosmicus sp.]|nr:hypothetical protein [Candidatus Nitrosocosmicus sp.]
MSDFAFFRFTSLNMLTEEEITHKNEIVDITEQVLDAEGIECDSRISKISEDQLALILEKVRKIRKKKVNPENEITN